MKNLGLIVSFFIFSTPCFAQTPAPTPSETPATPSVEIDLKDVMAAMGDIFSLLGKQIADPSKNADSILLVKKLEPLLRQALVITPDTIPTADAIFYRSQQLTYNRLILALSLSSIDLEEALLKNDQTAAIQALSIMAKLKSNGHSIFR